MKARFARLSTVLALAAAAACSSSNSSSPASTTGGTPSVAQPVPVSPAAGAKIPNLSQPVTLIVQNAVTTGGSSTYTFEVASDSAFAAKVFTKSGVAEDSGGQTGVVASTLPAGANYYWHVRAENGGTSGPFTAGRLLVIGPAISIDPPVPVAPLSGSTSNGWQPFTINNSSRVGAVGAMSYKFDVATDSAFTSILFSGTVSETGGTGGQTSYTPPAANPPPTTSLYWRATALDNAGHSSDPSAAVSFTWGAPRSTAADKATQEGLVLWTGAAPPGQPGHIVYGNFWNVEPLPSACGGTFLSPPIETLRVIDAIDRGLAPPAAIQFLSDHGYPTNGALWYPNLNVLGFVNEYMGIRPGSSNIWDLVLRNEC
ncbi:MAG TPA: hypothetical protein VEU08_18655 [Vicinamibacterales bacterium]|nr:hypothetical protein [Vicinamibacterales bacterium]